MHYKLISPRNQHDNFYDNFDTLVTDSILSNYYIFNKLKDKFTDVFKTGLHLQSVKLWETPSSYALYESE